MLDQDGLCSVVRLDGRIVASAALVPWSPEVGGPIDEAFRKERKDDIVLVEQGLSYEVKGAFVLDTPETTRKGLIERCTRELVGRLAERHGSNTDILLWIQIAEDRNGLGDYWRRRHYELVGPIEIKPKGLWGADHDFRFATSVKRINIQTFTTICS